MIEDLDGVAPEPTGRRHFVALSAATAALSLVLLIALVKPAPLASPPLAASPEASASRGPRMIISSRAPITHARVDLSRATVCRDGTRLNPPYFLSVDESTGQVSLGHYHDGSREFIGLPVPVIFRFDARTGFMIVTCATDDILGRWESDAR